MRILELLPKIKDYTRIKRSNWNHFLVRSEDHYRPLILCNFFSLQLKEYSLSYNELMAEDWEIVE